MSLEMGIGGRSVSGPAPEKQVGHRESCLMEVGMGILCGKMFPGTQKG